MFINDSVCVLFLADGCLVTTAGGSELWFHSVLGFKFPQQQSLTTLKTMLHHFVIESE